uniref:Dendrocyte expressed seven transmembrane protein n=1 Tax=Sphenodon punctatus TaxID=8508 RepID=A0A8D0GZQ4_SPHPU
MSVFASLSQHVWKLFVSERKSGWKNVVQLFAVCCTVSLIASLFLFLGLYSFLTNYPMVAFVSWAFVWFGLSIWLCLSKHMRCFSTLFLLSCGLREGRNALITAGTGVLVSGNIQNIFHNLKQLADSISCNLKAQKFTFLNQYIDAIRWILRHSKLSGNLFEGVVSLHDGLNVSCSISDDSLKQKLNNTKLQIQNVANSITSILVVQPYVSKRLLPLIGILLVLWGTHLFIRKFLDTHNTKFKNTYITDSFIKFDEQQRQQQKPCVLPLSKKEMKKYVVVPSFCQTPKERKSIRRFFLPVLANLCIWALFAGIDYLIYWLIFSVNKHLQDIPELEVHLNLFYHKNKDRNIIFNGGEVVQNNNSFKIQLFEPSCIPKSEIPLSTTAEMKRIQYLHAKLLRKRSKLLQGKGKRKWRSCARFHFWFPIFQAMRTVWKKQKDTGKENNV